MTKSNYVKSAVAGLVATAYSLIPQVGNAQTSKGLEKITEKTSVSIQRGLQAPVPVLDGETNTHVLYEMPFSKDLQYAIQNSEQPTVYTTSNNSYVKFNKDSTSLILGVHKSDLGKKIGVGVRDKSAISPCDKNGLGRFENSLPFTYLTINEQELNSEPKDTVVQKVVNNYNITINKIQSKEESGGEKLKDSKLILLTEANASLTDNLHSATISPQFKLGKNVSVGPYATFGIGENKEFNVTSVDETHLINENFGLYSRTTGTITEEMTTSQPFGFGGRISLTSNNKRWMANFDFGATNVSRTNGKLSMKGVDQFIRNGSVEEEKEYCFEDGFENTMNNFAPKVAASINYFPIKNTGLFVGAEVNHTFNKKDERFLGKQKNTNFAAKIGWRFGGNRR